MTKEVAEQIVKGITDVIECNTADIDIWAEYWGFTREEYEEFLDMAIKALDQTRWIPCSERLPKDLEVVNITWVNHNPASYYADIKDKPFTATGVYFNGQWYWWSKICTDLLAEYSHNYNDIIDDDIEIIAWMPLPKFYEPQGL